MRKIQCPTCKKPVLWSQDFPFRPFCSERCRIIDLGAWADESYAIPVQDNNQLEENKIDDLEENDEG